MLAVIGLGMTWLNMSTCSEWKKREPPRDSALGFDTLILETLSTIEKA